MLTFTCKTSGESSFGQCHQTAIVWLSAFSFHHFVPFHISVFLLYLISTSLPLVSGSATPCLALLCSPFSWGTDALSVLNQGTGLDPTRAGLWSPSSQNCRGRWLASRQWRLANMVSWSPESNAVCHSIDMLGQQSHSLCSLQVLWSGV